MLGTVLYLHGFLSGPTGLKARLVQQECQKRSLACLVPDLNEEPTKVWQQILALLKTYEPGTIGIVASSLGGFYAARALGDVACRAVLINPAIRPWDAIEAFLGEQKTSDGRLVVIKKEYAEQLRALKAIPFKDPSQVLVALSTADEVLNWKEARDAFSDSPLLMLENADHAVSHFARYVSQVIDFLTERKG